MPVHVRGRVFNAALPAANANLLSANVVPLFDLSEFRITFSSSKGGRLTMKREYNGTTVSQLLGTSNIGADEVVVYDIPTRAIESYNFSYSVTNGSYCLQVDSVTT